MNRLKLIPELVIVVVLALASFFIAKIANTKAPITQQINIYSELQRLLPQHQLQLLNVNFSDQVHYDNFAQLHSQITSIVSDKIITANTKAELNRYLSDTAQYIQIITMIKTSLRLVSTFDWDQQQLKKLSKNAILLIEENHLNKLKSEIFSYINRPQDGLEHLIRLELAKTQQIVANTALENNWQLFSLHIQFILDNYLGSSKTRHELLKRPIYDLIQSQVITLNGQHYILQSKYYLAISVLIVALLLLLIVILKKQQHALKNTSYSLENALEIKSQFLANMSHEIRTPMTGIIGLVELCLQSELNELQRSYLEKVDFSAKSLLTIINDILDFSKIESGQLAIENVEFKHNQLIDSLHMMLGKVAEDKHIELIFDVSPTIPERITGDPVRINQILLNLLSNAVKFTSQGHVILRAKLLQEQQQSKIHYQVEDTGIGLTQEQQARLFQRFSQADSSTTRKYGGTGLGLAIAKLLIDLMDGKVWIESKVNVGSTFNVVLPLKSIKPAKFNHDYTGLKVLLVEDYAVTQEVISKMSSYFRVNIDIASTVDDAIMFIKEKRYDLAMVDWNLGGESGLEFIKQVQNDQKCPGLLVICSAYSREYIAEHSDLKLFANYLPKPISLDSLRSAFQQASDIKLGKTPSVQTDILQYPVASPKIDEPIVDRETILLVEDNKINQIVATNFLQKLGLNVDLAENGQEAIKKIGEKPYKVVLMDVQMPVMDGIEATKILRQTYPPESLIIVALTANMTEEEIAFYQEVGMNAHLGKPYELDKIQALLEQYYTLVATNE